jgi:hypothetical protein
VQRYELTVNDASAQVLENELQFENMEVIVERKEVVPLEKANELYDVQLP